MFEYLKPVWQRLQKKKKNSEKKVTEYTEKNLSVSTVGIIISYISNNTFVFRDYILINLIPV